ncbi:MAG: sulfotransferase domain-containing protein [Actinomycetota bacterium]|nr:sulfotransferase domain-containing protein [Actinomycetota bacterium]
MPTLKKKMSLRLGRNTRLFIDLETGVTGFKGAARELRSRLGDIPAHLRKGAARVGLARPPAGKPVLGERDRSRPKPVRGSNTPVFFVTGLGKSGTSWLMRTLDGHPEILCKGEGRFFAADWRRANFDPEGTQALASSLYYALLDSEYLRLWVERSVWAREGDTATHLDNLTRLATEHFLLGQLRKTNKKLVGDKSPLLNADFIEEVSRVYPEARVIHIIRDGRDQAVSMLHHVWNRSTDQGGVQTLKPGEFERREAYRKDPQELLQTGDGMFTEERLRGAARSWNARVGKTAEDGPALLGPNYTEVRYEDLLERPDEEVGRLARFLGADTSEKAVRQAVGSASFEKLSKGRERGQEDTSSFYRKGVAGDWNNYFTERDREIYKEEAGELLIRLGYERDLDW